MELNDIQGLLVRGHGDLPEASFLLLRFGAADQARAWLRDQLAAVTAGHEKPAGQRMQIAFTYPGMQALEADAFCSGGFSVEFQQGMATEFRARVLGDRGESDPQKWSWGGSRNPEIHALVMLYAVDQPTLAASKQAMLDSLVPAGITFLHELPAELNPWEKEHFGFRDGISQPLMPGLKKKGPAANTVAVGEFILGYENGYHELPETPVVPAEMDPHGCLPMAADKPGHKDLGKNGSYMVFRQLRQDVAGFWEQIQHAVAEQGETAVPDACLRMGAKMLGRWPNGTPLTLSPEGEREELAKADDFLYAEHDREGYGCPLGSHVRRSNPRDAMPQNKPATSIKIANRHRILRRGRNFGPPLAPEFDPRQMLGQGDDGQDRGLHFICFNANIARQFEFVQHTWNNNPKFDGLYQDPDPILGIQDRRHDDVPAEFTIQQLPLRQKVQGLRRHVHVMGGAYFFMPGLRALRFLATFHPSRT